jgi:hypothetical protein
VDGSVQLGGGVPPVSLEERICLIYGPLRAAAHALHEALVLVLYLLDLHSEIAAPHTMHPFSKGIYNLLSVDCTGMSHAGAQDSRSKLIRKNP